MTNHYCWSGDFSSRLVSFIIYALVAAVDLWISVTFVIDLCSVCVLSTMVGYGTNGWVVVAAGEHVRWLLACCGQAKKLREGKAREVRERP